MILKLSRTLFVFIVFLQYLLQISCTEIILFNNRIDELRYMGNLLKNSLKLNPSTIPCTSFWEYACSKEKQAFPIVGQTLKNGNVKNLIDELTNRKHDFIAKTKVLNFFRSCKTYKNIDYCYEEVFTNFKSILGYAAMTANVSAYDGIVIDTIIKLFLEKSNSKSQFDNTEGKWKINEKFRSYENRFRIVTQSKLNQEYENIEMDPRNYHQNILNLKNRMTQTDRIFNDIVDISMFFHQSRTKPTSYYYPTFNAPLWMILYNSTVQQNATKFHDIIDCLNLPDFVENDNELKKIAVINYKAFKQTWWEFIEWLKSNELHKKITEQEDVYLREFGLNTKKMFFIIFAQNYCDVGKDIMDSVWLEGLRHSDDFSKVFACSEGMPMNPIEKCTK